LTFRLTKAGVYTRSGFSFYQVKEKNHRLDDIDCSRPKDSQGEQEITFFAEENHS
jgi:hypothetical protein